MLYRREFGSYYHGDMMMDEVGVLLDVNEPRKTAVLLKHGNVDGVEAYYAKARVMETTSPDLFNLVLLRSRHWPTALLNRFIEYSGGAERWWFEGEPTIQVDEPLHRLFTRIDSPGGPLLVRSEEDEGVREVPVTTEDPVGRQLLLALLPGRRVLEMDVRLH